MSTYVLMKILESAPSRYDRGIAILTLGKLNRSYDRLTSHIKKGSKVLDIGCGTGALSLRAALEGGEIKAIDINPQMMEIAKMRAKKAELSNIEFEEMGVAELEREGDETYDIVMSALCFSELSDDEIRYGLKEALRITKPGGLLLIADEVRPKNFLKRMVHGLLRFPLVVITYLLTQTTTLAVSGLSVRVEEAGFQIQSTRRSFLGDFLELVAKK